MSWQEIIKKFTAVEEEGHGFAASLVLMYLAFGQEYAYNMSKEFEKGISSENGWKEEQLVYSSKLKDVDQLHTLLEGMEKKGLLKSYKEAKGRRRRYFRLDENIILSPYSNGGLDGMLHDISRLKGFSTNEEKERASVCRFLDELSKKSRDTYFRRWSKIEKFDYLTFLGVLKEEAQHMKNEEIAGLLNKNIHYILEGEKQYKELKTHIETVEKIRSENKARRIKDELSAVDILLEYFEDDLRKNE
jgi:hypothetical protein